MKKARSAIIGCGTISKLHAEAICSMEGAELVGCADIVAGRAQKMAGEYGAKAYYSLEELLDSEPVDILHICTPHHVHTPMAGEAAKRGVNIFCEKPPAISRGQWAEFARLESSVAVGVCFQNRYNSETAYLNQIITSGAAGKLKGARAFVTWDRDMGYYSDEWHGKLSTEGGGVLINQAVHTMDLLVMLLGRPQAVHAVKANFHLNGFVEVEDTMSAWLDFGGGCSALLYASTAYCEDSPVMMEFICENVAVRVENKQVDCAWKDGRNETVNFNAVKAVESPSIGKAYWGTSHEKCIRDFYASVSEKRGYRLRPSALVDTMDTLFAIYESAGASAPVRL